MRRPLGLAAALASILILNPAIAQTGLPAGFVYLRDSDPTIAQDIRYAGSDNFVGRPLPGYDAAECVLRREVAEALKRVQADVAKAGLALKVYDCYRPARAVRAMAQWANDGKADGASQRFFPTLRKYSLFAAGYIAAQSAHSGGSAVDLTLTAGASGPSAPFDATAHYGPCSGPRKQRSPDTSIDMGTGFDCFDSKSHTRSPAISAEQRRSRALLVAAMAKQGFKNYFREWWHFVYAVGPPTASQDFPIHPRALTTPR
jgi:D-alanyl-D-alanine dipeptidase